MKQIILGILLLFTTQVWALPAPQQIQDAVHAGQYPAAEQMIREVIAAKPKSALAYYELGQILARENRHAEAVSALKQAQTLEPSLKFARSTDTFYRIYNLEQQKLASSASHPVTPAVTHTPSNHPAQVIYEPSPQTSSSASSSKYLTLIVILLIVIGAALLWVSRVGTRKAKQKLAAEQLAELVRLSDVIRDAELECRASRLSAEQKNMVIACINPLRDSLMRAIELCRQQKTISSQEMMVLSNDVRRITVAAKTGEFPAEGYAQSGVNAYGQPVPQQSGWEQQPPYSSQGYHAGNSGQGRSGSGVGAALGGFAAGAILTEMLDHSAHAGTTERIIEVVDHDRDDQIDQDFVDFDGSDSSSDSSWDNDDGNWGGDSFDSDSFDSGDSGSDDSSW